MGAATLVLVLALALTGAAQKAGETCYPGVSACTCDPDTKVCCASGEPQPCYPGSVTQNTASVCEVYQALPTSDVTSITFKQSTGGLWANEITCDNDWVPHRFLRANKYISGEGCLARDAGSRAMIPESEYGTCTPPTNYYDVCPGYFVCRGGSCLTSCVNNSDCYLFEPWNDISCPYARCNTETSLCERVDGGTPGTGGSCPAKADICNFGVWKDKANAFLNSAQATARPLSVILLTIVACSCVALASLRAK